MSIVTTFEAVPSRLFAIYAALFDSDSGEVKDRIEAWATPPSLRSRGGEEGESTTTLFSNTLAEARRLGLVEEVEGKLRLTNDARGGGRKGSDSEPHFISFMRRTLFNPDRAADTKQAGYMVALSWFLSSSPLRPMNFSKEPINELRALLGENASKFEISDYASWQSFLYWGRYLGFATIVGGGNNPDDVTSRRVIAGHKAASAAWKAYVDKRAAFGADDVLSALGQVPQFRVSVARIRQIRSEVAAYGASLPADPKAAIASLDSLVSQHETAWKSLAATDIPPSVVAFIRAAASSDARLNSYTPEVQTWLESHKLLDAFRIKLR